MCKLEGEVATSGAAGQVGTPGRLGRKAAGDAFENVQIRWCVWHQSDEDNVMSR